MDLFKKNISSNIIADQQGQALVEFAVILPILLLLLCGIIEFGRAMYMKNTLNNTARTAARTAAVTPSFRDKIYTAGQLSAIDSTDKIQQSIFEGLLQIDKSLASATATKNGDIITVKVIVPFNTIVPNLLTQMFKSDKQTPISLIGEASMRYE